MSVTASDRPIGLNAPYEQRVLSPRQAGPLARCGELWAARSLVPWFGRKFIHRLYARTWLGWWWIPLRPVLTVVPSALIFGGVLKAPSNGVPYLLFFIVGYGTWQVLDRGWYFATRCVEVNRRYLKRMYLPRLVLLVASPSAALLMYLIYALMVGLAVAYYTFVEDDFPLRLGLNTLLLPAGLALVLGILLSLGLWTSVLGAQARDVRWTVRSVLGVWFLFTPVIYPLSAVPRDFKTAAQFNPMTAPMEMTREALFSAGEVTLTGVAVSLGAIAIVASLGLVFFSKSEASAVDYL